MKNIKLKLISKLDDIENDVQEIINKLFSNNSNGLEPNFFENILEKKIELLEVENSKLKLDIDTYKNLLESLLKDINNLDQNLKKILIQNNQH